MSKKLASIGLKLLTICLCLQGQYFNIHGKPDVWNQGIYLYFTNLSNLLVMLTSLVLLVFAIGALRNKPIPQWARILQWVTASAITVTFLVYFIFLTPLMPPGSIWRSPNLLLHAYVPLAAIWDLCLFGSLKDVPKHRILWTLAPELLYTGLVYYCNARHYLFENKQVPYFFYDYRKLGWFRINGDGIGVVYWLVLILLGVIILSFGLGWIVKKREAWEDKKHLQEG